MSSFMRLTCSSLGDLAIQTHRGRADYAALKMVYGSWTSTPTQSGTVIEAFRVLSTADRTIIRSEIRKLDQYVSAAAESAESPAREIVWLYAQAYDEPVQRRARVVGISFSAVDGSISDASMAAAASLYDIAIERAALWEMEQGISRAWAGTSVAASCLSIDGIVAGATAPGVIERMQITGDRTASFNEVWAGWKSGVGAQLDELNQFVPTIKVNQLTIADRIGGGTLRTSATTTAQDGVAAEIHFTDEGGTLQRTDHKPRFSVDFNRWNSSTQTLPATIWPQYAGKYHLLMRYLTYAPDDTLPTAPIFSVSGINFFAVGAWDERLPTQYISHTDGQWRTIDLGVLTIGGGVMRRNADTVAFSSAKVGLAVGLPSINRTLTTGELRALYQNYVMLVDDFTLIPAEYYVHVKTLRSVGSGARLVVMGDDGGTATAYVTERAGTVSSVTGGAADPPYAVLERATVDSANWLSPPWGSSKLVVHAVSDGQSINDDMTVSVRISARTRSYGG